MNSHEATNATNNADQFRLFATVPPPSAITTAVTVVKLSILVALMICRSLSATDFSFSAAETQHSHDGGHGETATDWVDQFDVPWDSQSKNSSDSMPLVGGSLGCNVWVENDELLFYFSSPGARDEGRIAYEVRQNANLFRAEYLCAIRV